MGSKNEKRTSCRVMGSGEKEVVTMEVTGISADVREQIYKVGMPENAKGISYFQTSRQTLVIVLKLFELVGL